MLPPLLLERLRTWWRVARAQGKMLDGGWLFPGKNPIESLTRGNSTGPSMPRRSRPESTSGCRSTRCGTMTSSGLCRVWRRLASARRRGTRHRICDRQSHEERRCAGPVAAGSSAQSSADAPRSTPSCLHGGFRCAGATPPVDGGLGVASPPRPRVCVPDRASPHRPDRVCRSG